MNPHLLKAAASARGRVFRQVVAMEVIVLVPAGEELPHTDYEGHLRDATMEMDCGRCEVVAGESYICDVEELTP